MFKSYHASVILDNVDILYLKDQNVGQVFENKTSTIFFLKKNVSSLYNLNKLA